MDAEEVEEAGLVTDHWIVIPKWEDFQHRDAARSNVPTWIKDMTQQLSKDEYLTLTWPQRGLLHDIRLEYARSKRQLSASTTSLSRRLGQTVRAKQLEALVHAGFIELSASKPASSDASESAGSEENREEVKDQKPLLLDPRSAGAREHKPYDPPSDPVASIRMLIGNGAIRDRVDLETELRAQSVNGSVADELRALLPGEPLEPGPPEGPTDSVAIVKTEPARPRMERLLEACQVTPDQRVVAEARLFGALRGARGADVENAIAAAQASPRDRLEAALSVLKRKE